METQDLVPRLVLIGSVVAALVVYSRRRPNKLKQVEAEVTALPGEAAATITTRGQNMLDGVLDSVAEQAVKELKVVLKDGLKRLEQIVDDL